MSPMNGKCLEDAPLSPDHSCYSSGPICSGFNSGTRFSTYLILSFLHTNTDTFANSADPDETARNEPSYLDL